MIKKILLFAFMVTTLSVATFAVSQAVDPFPTCSSDPGSVICAAKDDKLFGPNSIWTRILDTFTYVIGAVSVLVIIVGGLRYITSGGDQAGITGAKNTILYAVIGLVVAILAYSIVHFVVSNI